MRSFPKHLTIWLVSLFLCFSLCYYCYFAIVVVPSGSHTPYKTPGQTVSPPTYYSIMSTLRWSRASTCGVYARSTLSLSLSVVATRCQRIIWDSALQQTSLARPSVRLNWLFVCACMHRIIAKEKGKIKIYPRAHRVREKATGRTHSERMSKREPCHTQQ